MQDEADAMGIDDVHGLHVVVQELGRRASIALEAEPHVFRRKGVAVVEPETLAQLELVHEPVRALRPGLGQTGRHVIAGQRLDQGVVQSIQEHERGADSWALAGVEKGGRDRGIEGNRQLAVRLGRGGLAGRCPQRKQKQERDRRREPTHVEPPCGPRTARTS